MNDVLVAEKYDDFITRLLTLIESGQKAQAVQEIIAINSRSQQIWVLLELLTFTEAISSQLHRQLLLTLIFSYFEESTLENVLRRAQMVDQLNRIHEERALLGMARKVNNAVIRLLRFEKQQGIEDVISIMYKLDRVLSSSSYEAPNIVRQFSLNYFQQLVRLIEFNVEIDSSLELVIEAVGAIIAIDFVPPMNSNRLTEYYQRALVNSVIEIWHLPLDVSSAITDTINQVLQLITQIEVSLNYITFIGVDGITTEILVGKIAPFLRALRNVQKIYFELTQSSADIGFIEPRIVQIHNEFPKVKIIGIAEILRVLNDILSWPKRMQEFRIREEDIIARQKEIERKNIENEKELIDNQLLRAQAAAQIHQIKLEQDQSIPILVRQAEIARINAETAQIEVDTRAKIIELDIKIRETRRTQLSHYIPKATEILKAMYPEINASELSIYLPQMVVQLITFEETGILPILGWHEEVPPTPPTLPEID